MGKADLWMTLSPNIRGKAENRQKEQERDGPHVTWARYFEGREKRSGLQSDIRCAASVV